MTYIKFVLFHIILYKASLFYLFNIVYKKLYKCKKEMTGPMNYSLAIHVQSRDKL